VGDALEARVRSSDSFTQAGVAYFVETSDVRPRARLAAAGSGGAKLLEK